MFDQSNRYTLTEAARLTGLSTEALRLRIRRGKLAAEKTNDGLRVVLTTADIEAIVAGQERQQIPTDRLESPNTIKVLEETVRTLREELSRGRAALETEGAAVLTLTDRAAHAEGEAAALREEAQRARAWAEGAEERLQVAARRLEEERSRAAAEAAELRTAGEAARLQAARAEERAEGFRLALAEARRPFWRRWIG